MEDQKFETEVIDFVTYKDAVARLVGAVIGNAIEPDKTKRLANGELNRVEQRGGEDIAWLDSSQGKFWLNFAEEIGLETGAIKRIAQNPEQFGYKGIGHGNWDVYDGLVGEPTVEELDAIENEFEMVDLIEDNE